VCTSIVSHTCCFHCCNHSSIPYIATADVLQQQAVKRKERYERAKDASLLPIDRTVGNLLEWMPIFMGFFWTSMLLTGTTGMDIPDY
jgi:hypothetical protein